MVGQKMTQDDKGGGVGVWVGPKKDDINMIYEQPLIWVDLEELLLPIKRFSLVYY